MQFFGLHDNETGVRALGRFESTFDATKIMLLAGLRQLKNRGKTRLVVDLVCFAYLAETLALF